MCGLEGRVETVRIVGESRRDERVLIVAKRQRREQTRVVDMVVEELEGE